ncbi:MAG: extracellular solute-binding protein [Actinomycetota bacterium]|nr:extracellular solute-binding protein [Actinomycetota bacterium]
MTALSGMTWDHPRGRAPLVALASRSGSAGDTTVEWSARSLQAFADHPLEELADRYDLLVIDHPHVPLVAASGLLVPLDEQDRSAELAVLESESVGQSFASYRFEGHVWALPVDAAAQVSAHRPDLISEPPSRWEDVLELASEGRVAWPAKPVDAMSSFLTLSAQRGEPVCSRPDRFVAREDGLAVLGLMHEMADAVDPRCLDMNPVEAAEMLASDGRVCYVPLAFGYVNYARSGFRANRIAYRDVPEGARGVRGSCLGGAGIAVSARSQDRSAAVDVACWLASAPVQRGDYYREGGQPANAAAWEDPEVDADSLGFFSGTRRTLEGAAVRPRHPGWLALQEVVGDLVHATLLRSIGDDECLDRLDDERGRLMGGHVSTGSA